MKNALQRTKKILYTAYANPRYVLHRGKVRLSNLLNKTKRKLLGSKIMRVSQELREVGKEHELNFWREFVRSDRFKTNWCNAVPNPELEIEIDLFVKAVASEINRSQHRVPEFLDIGSGPVSILTNCFKEFPANLRAADPLGDDYARLWDSASRPDLAKPVACAGEDLLARFGEDTFDLTHIRNAIDHAADPMVVFEQMIKITRTGGYIIVHGFEHEATAENWAGFHQWNLHCENNDFVVEGKNGIQIKMCEKYASAVKPLRVYNLQIPSGRMWCAMIVQVTK